MFEMKMHNKQFKKTKELAYMHNHDTDIRVRRLGMGCGGLEEVNGGKRWAYVIFLIIKI